MIQSLFTQVKILALLVSFCFAMFLFDSSYNFYDVRAYAHLFTTDETGTFVSVVDQVQTELDLVAANLETNNVSLAENHARKASSLLPRVIGEIGEDSPQLVSELMRSVFGMENLSSTSVSKTQNITQIVDTLNEKLDNAKIVRIAQVLPDSSFFGKVTNLLGDIIGGNASGQSSEQVNSRIEALAFAEIMDAVLSNYGKAYNVGFDMTNMSNMVMTGSSEMNSGSMEMNNTINSNTSAAGNMNMHKNMNMNALSMNTSSKSMAHQGKINEDYQLIHIADYQSAQALAKKGLEFFNTDLRQMAIIDKSIFVTKLQNGLINLNGSIESKASPMDVMMIMHSEVHPNLQQAFNLQLQ